MEAEVRDSAEMAFEVYGEQLQTVTRFKYLGSILKEGDGDWPAVAGNLERPGRSGVDCRRYLAGKAQPSRCRVTSLRR